MDTNLISLSSVDDIGMNYDKQKMSRPLAVTAGIVVLLAVGLAPAFADSASQVPLAPTNLSATPLSYDQIALTWSSPPNATQSGIVGYQILQNGQILVNNTGNTLTNYNDTGLFPGSIEQYQVAAWNPAGLGLFSGNASATTPIPANTTQLIQDPSDTASTIQGGNWTNHFVQHHDYRGLDNHTMPYERTHVGQLISGTSKPFNAQQKGVFYKIHGPDQYVSNPPHQWIRHVDQYGLHQAQVTHQFTNLNDKMAPVWPNNALAGMGDHQMTKLTDKYPTPDWTTAKPWAH